MARARRRHVALAVTSLVYETHSLTTDNAAGIATGWLPGALSAEGRRQAGLLGQRRRADGIDAVFSSDLGRAVETVRIAFSGCDIPVVLDARLRECDYGRLTGCPVSLLEPERTGRIDLPFPGGQSYRDVVDATADLLADLATGGWSRVLLIAHSANRWALQHLLLGAPLEDLVGAAFQWRPGWEFILPQGWSRSGARRATSSG
ncbi:MAG TPA: histidine phosphatase family protein [Dermatophilaceae bacterium]|nr:histidine phosphatase family protein [Dermatophilaceae bacterium]